MARASGARKRSSMGHLFKECQEAIQDQVHKMNFDGSEPAPDDSDDERLPIEGLNGKRINDRFVELANMYVPLALSDICQKKDTTKFTKTRWKKELTVGMLRHIGQQSDHLNELGDKAEGVVADFVAIYMGTQQFNKDLEEQRAQARQQYNSVGGN